MALFGGSFNPPHEGHLEIVERVARRKSIDEVWVLPVWRHPLGKKLPSFGKRLKECRRFFKRGGLKKIKIKPFENHPRATGYTVDLLKHLTRKFPRYRFSWVMGSDSYRQRKRWKRFGELRKMVRLIVFPRGPKSPIPNVASHKIRALTRK